ncbi:hypothetical protein ABK040_009415 [Willaertia magna]
MSDDIWVDDKDLKVDGEHSPSQTYDLLMSELNYNRIKNNFETLGIKEGASERQEEARQLYFEQGLTKGLQEGKNYGIIKGILKAKELFETDVIPNKLSTCTSWDTEKMNKFMEILQQKNFEDEEDNELKEIEQLISKDETLKSYFSDQ